MLKMLSLFLLFFTVCAATDVHVCEGCLTEDNKVVQCLRYDQTSFPSSEMEHCIHLFHGTIDLYLYNKCVQINEGLIESWFPVLRKIIWNSPCPCVSVPENIELINVQKCKTSTTSSFLTETTTIISRSTTQHRFVTSTTMISAETTSKRSATVWKTTTSISPSISSNATVILASDDAFWLFFKNEYFILVVTIIGGLTSLFTISLVSYKLFKHIQRIRWTGRMNQAFAHRRLGSTDISFPMQDMSDVTPRESSVVTISPQRTVVSYVKETALTTFPNMYGESEPENNPSVSTLPQQEVASDLLPSPTDEYEGNNPFRSNWCPQ